MRNRNLFLPTQSQSVKKASSTVNWSTDCGVVVCGCGLCKKIKALIEQHQNFCCNAVEEKGRPFWYMIAIEKGYDSDYTKYANY